MPQRGEKSFRHRGSLSLSKEREPFVNGVEGCVRETREGCPARNIARYAAAAAGSYQTVQGITRILVEHTFYNKNLVTTSCGSHHAMIQCVGDSSTERGCKHEVQADKASQVGQAAAANADDKGSASGQRRLCGRLLQDRQEPVCDITAIRPGLCVRRQGQDAHAHAGAGGSFLGYVGAAPAAVPSHYTTRSRGLRPAAAAYTLDFVRHCWDATTAERGAAS